MLQIVTYFCIRFHTCNKFIAMFSSTKAGHIAQIFATSIIGQVASHELMPPDPDKIESYGRLIIQAVVAIVTIWATVRKAFQKPENVVKASAVSVAAPVAGGAVSEPAAIPAADVTE